MSELVYSINSIGFSVAYLVCIAKICYVFEILKNKHFNLETREL